MRANRAYRLLVRRGGWIPSAFADPGRVDHIELVDVASGEVLLFWDLPPRAAARLARALRSDLAQRSDEEVFARWVAPEHDNATKQPIEGSEFDEPA